MADINLEDPLKRCIEKNNTIIRKLYDLMAEVDKYHTTCNIVRTGGTIASVTGTGVFLASLFLAPLSGGLSLFVGIGLGAGGTITNIATNAAEQNKSKDIISEIHRLVDSRMDTTQILQKEIKKLNDFVDSMVEQGFDRETATQIVFRRIANGAMGLIDFNFLVMNRLLFSNPVIVLPFAGYLIVFSSLRYFEGVGKGGKIFLELTKDTQLLTTIFKTSGQVAGGAFKVLSRVAVVTSIAVAVVDVGFLIKDWVCTYPTITSIQNLIGQLREENEHFEKILKKIDECKERVYLSTIATIPIIGTNEKLTLAAIKLFNNDITACITIFKEYGLNWPFETRYTLQKLVDFIVSLKTSQESEKIIFDKVALTKIISTVGVKGQELISVKVQVLLEELERLRSNAQHPQQSKEKKSSKKGEYVINNNVISVYRNIIDSYVERILKRRFSELIELPQTSDIFKDYHNAFSSEIQDLIQNKMVVQIEDYFDANGLIYGIFIFMLRESAVQFMIELSQDENNSDSIHNWQIDLLTNLMNSSQVFVDYAALTEWLKRHKTKGREDYNKANLEVQTMFRNIAEKLKRWIAELKTYGYL